MADGATIATATTVRGTSVGDGHDRQSRGLLLAVVGAWVGFLGVMAIAAHHAALVGAVAVITGLTVVVVALRRVVQDGPVV